MSATAALGAPIKYGKYTLYERLGIGGMAEVFLALQEGAGGFAKKVVVKRILGEFAQDKTFIDLFLHEAQLAAHLSHPNVVHIFDMGQEGETFFIAMEYVPGPNLLELLRLATLANDLRPQAFAKIASGVAEALHYAHHAQGPDGSPLEIVHRDINPPNIIISLDGVPKVCDFGVAKSAASETTTGSQLKGKQTYMSPEQIRGETLDGRADLFSLGVVLFETTTGKRLFKRDSELGVLNAVLSDPIPRPSSLVPGYPPRLDEIVMWCLERERDKRCPDARTLHIALEEYLRQDPAGYLSQVALADWVRKLVPVDAQKIFTGASSLSAVSARPPSRPTTRPSTSPGGSRPSARPDTKPPLPFSEVSAPLNIAIQPAIIEPQTEPFRLPPAAAPIPWKWVGLGLGVLAGALGIVQLGRSLQKPAAIVEAPKAAAPTAAELAAANENAAKVYTDEARRLIGQNKFGPAANLVAQAKGLKPQVPQTNVAIAELEEEAEVGARLAGAQQALTDGDSERAATLAKLVLDKEPTQVRALELLKLAHAKLVPVHQAPTLRSSGRGAVRVDAPAGARVYIDDEPIGEAPITRYLLPPGVHHVEVRRDGFRAEQREIRVVPAQTYVVSARMDAREQVQVALAPQPQTKAAPAAPAKVEVKPAALTTHIAEPRPAITNAPLPTPVPMAPVAAGPVGEIFSEQMTRPARVTGADVSYPAEARTASIEGTVIAQCAISEAGAVHDCKILKHLPFLDQPVLDALNTWHMKPATREGKPVALRSYPFAVKIVAPR
jgi:TonB family protein